MSKDEQTFDAAEHLGALWDRRAVVWQCTSVVKSGPVSPGLQEYLAKPELVAGWVTDQAVVLNDGTMRLTMYFKYGHGCALLRCSLPPDHHESEMGLWDRFDAGERYAPDPVLGQAALEGSGEGQRAGRVGAGTGATPGARGGGSANSPRDAGNADRGKTRWNFRTEAEGATVLQG